MVKFDAWVQPWIPVELNDNSFKQVSIFQALKDAHNITAIRAATPTETFGISRLLITILTDIYRPKRWDDVDEIRQQGFIPSSKLEEYYNTCLAEGSSFDLFDTKRPFLQYVFSDADKPTPRPIGTLLDHIPTGNNVPHFVHSSENSHIFDVARCLQALCVIPFYEKHKRGRKVTTGINGTPPIYYLYNGDTLFDTLIVSIIPLKAVSYQEFGLPIWREKNYYDKQNIIKPELLHGLFSAPIKVQLIPSNDRNLIEEIFIIDQGINYKDVVWKDPHVAYNLGKKGESIPLRARAARAVWRDLPIIIQPNALTFLFDWRNRSIKKDLIAYAKINELKGTVFMAVNQFVEELKIPQIFLDNEHKRQYYANAITLSDDISKDCGNALKRTLRQLSGEGNIKEVNPFADVLPNLFSNIFLNMIKETLESSLYDQLIKADISTPVWESNINEFLVEKMRLTVFYALNVALGNISDENTDILILKSKLREYAVTRLNILLKKGGYSSDKNRSSK